MTLASNFSKFIVYCFRTRSSLKLSYFLVFTLVQLRRNSIILMYLFHVFFPPACTISFMFSGRQHICVLVFEVSLYVASGSTIISST